MRVTLGQRNILKSILNKKFVISVCLIVLIFAMLGSQRRGLKASYYPNAEWIGEPVLKKIEKNPYLRGQSGENILSAAAFSVKWKGYIAVEQSGAYRFATNSDDGSFLRINGETIVDNGGRHGKKKVSAELFLEKGLHSIEFLYFQIGGYSIFEALWAPPDKNEQPIPSDVFYPKRPGRVSMMLNRGVVIIKKFGLIIIAGLLAGSLILFPIIFLSDVIRKKKNNTYHIKELIFSGILIISLLVMIEFCSWVFLTIFQKQFTFFDAAQYLVSEEQQGKFSKIYHPEFGWNVHFDTPYGERPRQTLYDKPIISSFGDSFTFCDEVDDHETWQTYLSDLLEMDAYNFGIGGYGTDQAYLKFLSEYPKIRTPIVMLGLTTENINRIVNVYRPFYFLKTAIRSTKPRFRLEDDKLVLIENPVRSKDDIKKLGDIRFIQKMGENDWWYNLDNYPIFQFPYTKILFNKRLWLEIYYGKGNRKINDADPRPWVDLWKSEEASNMMFRIFDAFVKQAKESQAIPIIILLPLRYEVIAQFETQQHRSRLATVLEYCERNDYLCFDSITPLAKTVKTREEVRDLYAIGHVSAKGNRIIANALHHYLEQKFPDILEQYRHPGKLSAVPGTSSN